MIVFKCGKPITNITFLKTIQDPEIASQKTSIVDILCTDDDDNQYIVEMQVAKEKGFEKRAQYYAAKAYCSQAEAGGSYHDLKEVIFVAITNFVMLPNKTAYKSDHIILDRVTHEQDLKDFSFTFLELPKFKKGIHELTNRMERWIYFLAHAEEAHEKDLSLLIGDDETIEKAYAELNRFSWNEEELRAYEASIKALKDYQASM